MVYHLAWMFSDRGLRVVAADLDPQSNLTAAFLEEARLESIFSDSDSKPTIFGAVNPLMKGTGDIVPSHVENIADGLGLVLGDMALSTFEDQLSEVWPKCMDRDERALRVTSAFWRIMQAAGESREADGVLVDLGPNLGAINRAALIASDFVVIPLGLDLFSLQGLRNLGPALRRWREQWQERLKQNPVGDVALPSGSIEPIGYIVLRHSIRIDRPVKAFERRIARMPATYAESVLNQQADCEPGCLPGQATTGDDVTIDSDPHCIAKLKDYRSLMPMAQEARKPIFFLKPADGAMGAHTYAVTEAYKDFHRVAQKVAERAGMKPLSD
jgi:cellulose biosynthesis protein BcsQ